MHSANPSASRDLPREQCSAVTTIGFLCFSAALFLSSLQTAQLPTPPAMLLGVLMLWCASGQILAGVCAWRQQQPLPALLLIAFGLFWFSRLASDILPNAGIGTPLSAPTTCGLLLLWGIFALILSGADECPRLLRLALGGIASHLLLQAAGTLLFSGLLLPLAGFVGLSTAFMLAAATVHRNLLQQHKPASIA